MLEETLHFFITDRQSDTLCGRNISLFNVNVCGTHDYYCHILMASKVS